MKYLREIVIAILLVCVYFAGRAAMGASAARTEAKIQADSARARGQLADSLALIVKAGKAREALLGQRARAARAAELEADDSLERALTRQPPVSTVGTDTTRYVPLASYEQLARAAAASVRAAEAARDASALERDNLRNVNADLTAEVTALRGRIVALDSLNLAIQKQLPSFLAKARNNATWLGLGVLAGLVLTHK